MIGITSGNGFPLPMEQRVAKIKAAGFDSILLWWGTGEEACRADRVAFARKQGLHIENAHADTKSLNSLWLEGDEGNDILLELKREVLDCAKYGMETLVLHLTNGNTPPLISALGISRVEQLIRLAEQEGIRLAFENVRKPEHTRWILDHFTGPTVGLCYDSGHEHFWTPEVDWLVEYGNRVFAIHLHDNNRDGDAHLIPFDGTVNWSETIKKIAASSYSGAITVESQIHSSTQYREKSLESFLALSYQSGVKLAALLREQREDQKK